MHANWRWAELLDAMGVEVQQHIIHLMRSPHGSSTVLSEVTGEEGGDRIYTIDREVEPILEKCISAWPSDCFPLQLIAEGLGETGRLFFESPTQVAQPPIDKSVQPKFIVIIDPIDGTRMLMYDKRSAWFLAAVVPFSLEQNGESPTLKKSIASVIAELPTSKQSSYDSFVAARWDAVSADGGQNQRIECRRRDCWEITNVDKTENSYQLIEFGPSSVGSLEDGFLSVMSCFPGTKSLAAELVEAIAGRDGEVPGMPEFFDDQYISTGGQLVELITGKDRCVIDLRPLFNRIQSRSGKDRLLESHPYDMAGWLVAELAGVIVTDGFGNQFDAPLDVSTGVHWCGYANAAIQQIVEPIIQDWLEQKQVIKI